MVMGARFHFSAWLGDDACLSVLSERKSAKGRQRTSSVRLRMAGADAVATVTVTWPKH